MSNSSIRLACFALLASVVACGEQATAPVSHAPADSPRLSVSVSVTTVTEFDVSPLGGVFPLGPHSIHFPANSICDPLTSSYGVTQWDAPCNRAPSSVRIRAEVRKGDGFHTIVFSPALRFVPSTSVKLTMQTAAAKVLDASRLPIYWAPNPTAQRVDEGVSDSTMRTFVSKLDGVAYRRIKHFSTYAIKDGESGDTTTTP